MARVHHRLTVRELFVAPPAFAKRVVHGGTAIRRIIERIRHRRFLRDLEALTRLTPDCRTGSQMCLIGQYAMTHAGTHAFDGIPGVHFLGGQFAEHREAVYDHMEDLIALGQRHDLLPESMPFRRLS